MAKLNTDGARGYVPVANFYFKTCGDFFFFLILIWFVYFYSFFICLFILVYF